MLLKCCLLDSGIALQRHAIIFYICVFLVYLCLIYVICFFIIILIFITSNHIIPFTQKDLFFGHVCQKFNLRVLLSFCLTFCQFLPRVAYKSAAYKKSVYYKVHQALLQSGPVLM